MGNLCRKYDRFIFMLLAMVGIEATPPLVIDSERLDRLAIAVYLASVLIAYGVK